MSKVTRNKHKQLAASADKVRKAMAALQSALAEHDRLLASIALDDAKPAESVVPNVTTDLTEIGRKTAEARRREAQEKIESARRVIEHRLRRDEEEGRADEAARARGFIDQAQRNAEKKQAVIDRLMKLPQGKRN